VLSKITPPREAAPPSFTAGDLGHFRVLREFREALADAQAGVEPHSSFLDARRKLELGDYLGLMLFGLLNPIARTLRALSYCSKFEKVRKDVCSSPASLGSLSEAQHLVDVGVLERVLGDLVERRLDEVRQLRQGPASKPVDGKARQVIEWMAHDGSCFPALERMGWALYGSGPKGNSKGVKLHLSFHVEADIPARASICEAAVCERGHLRKKLVRGSAYIADRLYGMEHAFFRELEKNGCLYCIRIKDEAVVDVIEELPVSEQDRRAGVLRQCRARLGLGKRTAQSPEMRLVYVRGVDGMILLLATNLDMDQLGAADVALLYKRRWEIEYYFRWMKCIMGCGHWMAESRNGASIQIYLALIGSLLLQLQLGRRPSKRIWETLQWHQCGMVSDGELKAILAQQLASEQRRRESKTREAFWKRR
jgi:Transposase DDE domain